jgi:nitroimidazol reductase NimA-like FMN-containing flavoprotein (pyridoxamine 5'-phosphate oxidase superfamily)
MPRETDLTMSPDEIRSFIRSEGLIVLGTVEPDHTPFAEALPCDTADDALTFTVPIGSRSSRNIERSPQVCAVIENDEERYYHMRSVTVHGTALLIEKNTDRDEARYSLPLDDIISFDFSKIKLKH